MAQDENDQEGSQRQLISERDIKILFVTSKELALASTLKFITKRSWQAGVVPTMKEAFEIIAKEKYTHVFVSFTLPTNHKKMEFLLKTTFGVVPILYSETFESTTYSQMRKIGFEHAILSPISGPTVQMKVRNSSRIKEESFVTGTSKNKNKKTQNYEEAPVETGPQTVCQLQDLPGGGYWQRVPEKQPTLWKLSTFLDTKVNNDEGTFFYEGENPPRFTDQGVWELQEQQGRIYFVVKANKSKKEKKRNWWEKVGAEEDESSRNRKTKAYKYVIEPFEDEADKIPSLPDQDVLPNYIHVKGQKAEKRSSDKETLGSLTSGAEKIIIRERTFRERESLILDAKVRKYAGYNAVDEIGRVHPFFEVAELDLEEVARRLEQEQQSAALAQESEGDNAGMDLQIHKGEAGAADIYVAKGKKRKKRGYDPGEASAESELSHLKGEKDESELSHLKGERAKKSHHDEDDLSFQRQKGKMFKGEDREEDDDPDGEQASADDESLGQIAQQFRKKKKKRPKWEDLDKFYEELELNSSDEEEDEETQSEAHGSYRRRKRRGERADAEEEGFEQGLTVQNEKDHKARAQETTDDVDGPGVSNEADEKGEASKSDSGDESEKNGRVGIAKTGSAFGPKLGSILAQSTIKTLEELSAPQEKRNPIQNTKRIGVIPIQTELTKGLLLIAVGNDREVTPAVLAEVKRRLVHHVKMRGQDIEEQEELQVQIEQVDFVEWGKIFADFLALDQLGEDEVGVAFLPGKDIIPGVAESAEDHMVGIGLSCIKPEVAISFDLFIYLPQNKKYVRYIKKGQRIDPKQVEKLSRFNIEHIHIRKVDIKAFKAYCAANFINIKVQDSKFKKVA